MALSEDEAKRLVEILKEQARAQQEINSGIDGYLAAVKKVKAINETVAANIKIQAKIQAEMDSAALKGNIQDYNDAKNRLKILKDITKELEEQGAVIKKNLAEANAMKMTFASMGAGMVKNFIKIPKLVENSFGKLKSYGLFEMDKAIKQSALDMGLLGKRSASYQATVRNTALSTNELGMGIKELAKMQSTYSDELGRTVELGDSGLKAMSEMAAATQLGVEGAAKLSAEMDNQGLSAERTKDFVEQTMNDSTKMGLNTSKVIKNIQNNMKMLNKYNFKGGVQGLAKMAQTTSKLGVDMNFVAGMAEKLFDIEGAVDMSAQLQVMGGEWSKLADPFKLMYMARNDMEGLTEAMGEAAKSATHFNKETGTFDISALEMHKLRKIAEQTGVSYEELATAGKNAAKFSKIKSQVGFSMSKDAKEFLTNTAKLDENGKAYIEVDGSPKFLSELGKTGKELIEKQMLEKKTLKERAKAAQTFDESLTNLMNMMKTTMLPIIDGITEVLGPLVTDLFANDNFKKQMKDLGKDIGLFVKSTISFFKDNPIIQGIGKLAMAMGPKGILATLIGGSLLMKSASWISNGMMLAQGFNLGAAGKGGIGAMLGKAGKAGGLGLAGAAVGMGTDYLVENQRAKGNTKTADAVNVGGSMASGALTGAAIGSLIPVIGTVVGGIVGGVIGGAKALWDNSQPVNDGIFGKPIHDGKIPSFGNDFSKGRGIIQGGKITPIDNKDDLLAMKPGGAIDKTLGKSSSKGDSKIMKVEFGTIHFKFDDLVVKTTGGDQSVVSKELLNNPHFTRDIARMIHVETEKAINGGKLKG